jgi:tripartite-type tricarboxylate transporter receptor subunit TctC
MITGIDFITAPYKGTGPAMTDVLAGQASFTFTDMIAGLPYVNAGRLKVLGIATATRLPRLPKVPTLAESGVPGFDAMSWVAIFSPAATPRAIVAKLNAEIRNILKTPEVQEKLAIDGSEFGENTPEQLDAYLKNEVAKWAKVIKVSGARLD